ncbi:MAG TPA: AAA family ATPase [Candidatus Binataceae bacterium]|nr:AAA family ATPase [Candidatus Binataceae bacterium]
METQTQYREAVETAVATVFQSTSLPEQAIFRKEGEYWTVGHDGKSFRLKDSKGLGYLAHLLRHPATEFHVLDLAGGIASQREQDETSRSAPGLPRGDEDLEKAGIHIGSLGDAGEMLDEQAKVAYRRRLSELREELDEAKELGNVERAEQAEQEIDALTRELSRAVGLGGRNRKAASASERARQSVTKTIKSVLERIAESDARLRDIFSQCIRTGTFCSYQPNPDFPIEWEFAAGAIEAEEEPASKNGDPTPVRTDRPRTSPPVLEVSPFSLAARTAFVGRETERSAIRIAIDRALSGHGSLVMLGGGPGVGKSRLAMEMGEYASRVGFRCLVGHCYERDEPFPYLPFVEIIESSLAQAASLDDFRRRMGDSAPELAQIVPSLRRVFPDIPQPLELPTAQKRRYLFQSISEGLARAARTRSFVYIVEDLHWADESTLALLIHLANRVAQLPVVIIGTYRDGYSQHNSALVRTLEELIRMGTRPLKLGGLSRDAVAQMLQGLSRGQAPDRLVNLIFEESQGYPFFIEEVYRHLVEEGKVFDEAGQFRTDIKIDEVDVPENVRLIIGRRLERFNEHEKRVLTAAAMIGRSFSFRLLTEVSQGDVDELFTVIEKAQQMGIIVPSSEGPENPFTFAHELVRQTLLAGISAPRKQRMHAAVADAIELVYPRFVSERAGEIADHLLKAGSFADGRRLVRYLTLAGKNALEVAGFEEARRNFRSALSHKEAVEARERADLLASLAIAELSLEHWDAALTSLREALEIYTNLGDREMIGKSFGELADAFIWVGRFQDALETARRGLDYLGQDISANRLRLLAVLGQASAASAGREKACEALREALDIASKLSDPKLEARVLGARSIVNLHFFRLREAAEDGLRSEQLGGSEAPPWQRALQLRVLHQTLLTLGRLEEAIRIADELEPLATKIGQAYSIALCLSTRTWLEFVREPDLAKLDAGFQEVSKSDAKARFPFWETLSEVQLSVLDFIRGNWAGALSHAHVSSHTDPEMSSSRGLGEGVLFRQMAYAGDRVGALLLLEKNSALLPFSGRENIRGAWWMLALVVEGLFMLGEQVQAGRLYPLVRELIDTGAVVGWPIPRYIQTIAGLAAAGAQEWKATEEHFRVAGRQADFFPDRLEQAEIRRFHAMMLIDRAAPGDREKAQTLLREALESYTQIGMPRHIEMTQALLR